MKDINLIPKSYFKDKKNKKKKIYIIFGVIFLVLLLATSIIFPIRNKKLYQDKLDKIIKKAEETSGYLEKAALLDELHIIYENREEEAGKIIKLKNDELKIFKTIEESRTENIFILNYKLGGEFLDKMVVLNCISKTEDDIINFAKNLRNNEILDNVNIVSVNKLTENIVKENPVVENGQNISVSNKYSAIIELIIK